MSEYTIHGSAPDVLAYRGNPNIKADIEWDDPIRPYNNEIIQLNVRISLSGLSGSFFGYEIRLYAGLNEYVPDDDDPIVYKDNIPSQWYKGQYSGTKTLYSYSSSDTAQLNIYLKSNCDCENYVKKLVRTIKVTVPKYYKKYNVVYDANGGYQAPSPQTKEEGSVLKLTENIPFKFYSITYNTDGGYLDQYKESKSCTFVYWTSPSGTIYYRGNYYYYDNDLYLKAVWSNPTGSSMPIPTKDGKALKGWYTKEGTKVDASYVISSDIEVYAQWEDLVTYKVTYDANGGSNPPNSQSKRSDSNLTLTNDIPDSKMYTITYDANDGFIEQEQSELIKEYQCMFDSWNTSQDGSGTKYSRGQLYTINKSLDLFATWTDPKVGTLPIPTYEGKTFMGWYDESGNVVTPNTIINNNQKFTAKWATYIYVYTEEGWEATLTPKIFSDSGWEDTEIKYIT